MMFLDAERTKVFRNDLQDAVNKVAKKYGVHSIEIAKRFQYSPKCFQLHAIVNVTNPDDPKEFDNYIQSRPSAEKAKDALFLSSVGLPVDLIGKTIRFMNRDYLVFCYHVKRRQKPILVVAQNGRAYSFSVADIKQSKIKVDIMTYENIN